MKKKPEKGSDWIPLFLNKRLDKGLHWTTFYSEKFLLAVIGGLTMLAAGMDIYKMILAMSIELGDLFLLFIYAEIVGMVGAFYGQQNSGYIANHHCNDRLMQVNRTSLKRS